jgi:hypothetical protein
VLSHVAVSTDGHKVVERVVILLAFLDPIAQAKNENGEPIWFPVSPFCLFTPWQRPRDVASGTHRKSGAVIRPTYACQVESFRLPSAHFLI